MPNWPTNFASAPNLLRGSGSDFLPTWISSSCGAISGGVLSTTVWVALDNAPGIQCLWARKTTPITIATRLIPTTAAERNRRGRSRPESKAGVTRPSPSSSVSSIWIKLASNNSGRSEPAPRTGCNGRKRVRRGLGWAVGSGQVQGLLEARRVEVDRPFLEEGREGLGDLRRRCESTSGLLGHHLGHQGRQLDRYLRAHEVQEPRGRRLMRFRMS